MVLSTSLISRSSSKSLRAPPPSAWGRAAPASDALTDCGGAYLRNARTSATLMIATSLAAMRIAQTRGHWLAILIAFTALPIRALIAASVITGWGVVPVQILDGVGAGMLSVAVLGLVA